MLAHGGVLSHCGPARPQGSNRAPTRESRGTVKGPAKESPAQTTSAGQTCLETNSTRIVRTMFVLYTLLIVGGIVFFVAVGLTQQ